MTIPDWRSQAACLDAPLNLFFGPDGEREAQQLAREAKAAKVCGGCPVRLACLEFALASFVKAGVWGGLGESERANEQRRRRRRAKAA